MLNIKKSIIFGFISILCSCASNPYRVQVDDKLKPSFDYLVNLFEKNNVNINYRKIKYIRLFDLNKAHGRYIKKYKVIYIDNYSLRWDWIWIYEDVQIIILAHEMAHSQKIDHNNDSTSIMSKNADRYITDIIERDGVEKSVLDIFKK